MGINIETKKAKISITHVSSKFKEEMKKLEEKSIGKLNQEYKELSDKLGKIKSQFKEEFFKFLNDEREKIKSTLKKTEEKALSFLQTEGEKVLLRESEKFEGIALTYLSSWKVWTCVILSVGFVFSLGYLLIKGIVKGELKKAPY